MPTKKILPAWERLERRLALAGLFTFTDIDGDVVTVKTSKGGNADLAAALTLSGGTSGQLQSVNLAANPAFIGTTFTLTVKKAGGGDGFAAVGHIDAVNVDVGKISIRGDLGRIVAGDANPATPGVVALAVASLGRYGTMTGAPDLASAIRGDLKTLTVDGDVQQARMTLIGGGIGAVKIGGSLVGGAADDSGRIAAASIGSLRVGGSIAGAAGARSASVSSGDGIGRVAVGTSILGGGGQESGSIMAEMAIGRVTVGRDVVGGQGMRSGFVAINPQNVQSAAGIGNFTIGGSVVGGTADMTGAILGIGLRGSPTVTIRGDVRGGGGGLSGAIAAGAAKALSIGGSLIGAMGELSGALLLRAGKVGRVSVTGSIVGGGGKQSGGVIGDNASPLDIGTVLVGGSLLGGVGDGSGTVFNPGGAIAKVSIRGSVGGGAGKSGVGNVPGSGSVVALSLGVLSVGGNVTGGTGELSALLGGFQYVKRVAISGSLVGGAGDRSGLLLSLGDVGTVSIGKNMIGGQGTLSGSVMSLGGSIAKVTVGGSIQAGPTAGAGSVTIGAARNLVSLAVKGDILGAASNLPLQVFAGGADGGSGIRSVKVGGSVSAAVFLAGWEPDFADGVANPANGNASIGRVRVTGSFVASSIAAGITSPQFPLFGTQLDSTIPGGTTCSIGSVTIGGFANGIAEVGQHFGIVSRQVGTVKVKGVAIAIPAANGATPIGDTGNFVIRVVTA